jgi:beta-fructofuranosidase
VHANLRFAPRDLWVWDFWLARDDDTWHLFHLQAPRSVPPALRHEHARVGHAISTDLHSWQRLGTVLEPGPPGAWDDHCIWTGSVMRWRGRWCMLYTGRSRRDLLVQRIGLAVSDDLHTWEKHPANPVLEANPRWYQTRRDGVPVEFITARRRPRPGTPRWALALHHMREALAMAAPPCLARCVRTSHPLAGRGCIALAQSDDLVTWDVRPPLHGPGGWDHLECPQLLAHEGAWWLVFSTRAGWANRRHVLRPGGEQTGAFAWRGPHPFGPYRPVSGAGVLLGSQTRAYATRVVRAPDGTLQALSWVERAGTTRRFSGGITAPVPVELCPPSR